MAGEEGWCVVVHHFPSHEVTEGKTDCWSIVQSALIVVVAEGIEDRADVVSAPAGCLQIGEVSPPEFIQADLPLIRWRAEPKRQLQAF